FPGGGPIVLAAFCVVLGTLVSQGFTLRPLLDRLGFEADGGVGREISRGRLGMMQAALDTLAGERSPAAAAVREGYLAAREVAASPEEPQGPTEHDRLRLRAITAQRLTLHRLREEGAIGDEAFQRLEVEVDWDGGGVACRGVGRCRNPGRDGSPWSEDRPRYEDRMVRRRLGGEVEAAFLREAAPPVAQRRPTRRLEVKHEPEMTTDAGGSASEH